MRVSSRGPIEISSNNLSKKVSAKANEYLFGWDVVD